jgi:ribonuclease P/MRP protein subunit POP1
VACEAHEDGKHVGLPSCWYTIFILFTPLFISLESFQGVQPTEKSFRPSHRASLHGAILHDASYESLIELQGAQKILKRLLEFCCEPYANPGAVRYLTGARVCDTHIYEAESFPFGLISPITVLWRPVDSTNPSRQPSSTTLRTLHENGDHNSAKKKRRRKQMNKAEETSLNQVTEDGELRRTVWIRSHPSAYDAVHEALLLSASFALEAFKKTTDGEKRDYKVDLLDRRQQVNVFEIMGPKSSQIIRGALTPVVEEQRKEFKEVFDHSPPLSWL